MNVGILILGNGAFPADNVISEYKNFIETNTSGKLPLNLTVRKYPQLPSNEIACQGTCTSTSGCYFVTPWSLSQYTKSLLPSNSQVNIVAWNNENLPICWVGGTWGGNVGPNGVPLVSIPFGWAPIEPWGPWSISFSQTFVHEFIHSITIILSQSGMPVQYSADDCGKMGYDSGCASGYICDPGWAMCYKAILAQITDPMYTALQNSQPIQQCQTPLMNFNLQ